MRQDDMKLKFINKLLKFLMDGLELAITKFCGFAPAGLLVDDFE